MRQYEHIPQENDFYCVPACLQMILKSRGLAFDSQKQIMTECGNKLHIKDEFETYLRNKKIPLHCHEFSVRESSGRDFDSFVDDALKNDCDILVTYAFEELYKTPNKGNHASLLLSHGIQCATLIDPDSKTKNPAQVSFDDLIRAMFVAYGGFHCFHQDKNVLERIYWF